MIKTCMTAIHYRKYVRHIEASRGKAAKRAACDRGYRGKREVNGTSIVLPGKTLKQDTRYQRDKKRKQCKRHAQQSNPSSDIWNRIIEWREITWRAQSVIASTYCWLLAPGIWNNGCWPFFCCFSAQEICRLLQFDNENFNSWKLFSKNSLL